MALYGEGDPRWLVQQRPDGRNVNSWHWESRDVSGTSKTELKRRLSDIVLVDNDEMRVLIKSAEKVDGDVELAKRKGRPMVIFDLDLVLNWEGSYKRDAATLTKGTVEFNIDSEDYLKPDYQVRYKDGPQTEAFRTVVKNDGTAFVSSVVTAFVDELKTQAQGGASAATANASSGPASPSPSTPALTTTATATASASASAGTASAAPVAAATPVAKKQRDLTLRYEYRAPPAELYNCMLDAGRIGALTQSPATIEARVGGAFSMFGGAVTGTYKELTPNEKIVQQWRSSSWPADVSSTVTVTFAPSPNGVAVHLHQAGIPDTDFDRTESGWKDLYFRNFRMMYPQV